MVAKRGKPSQSKAVVRWDEELAKEAQIAAGMEANTGGGQFFSVKGGILTWQDAPMPNNEMAVVILDYVFENVFYETDFDPDSIQPPTCFAFGRDEKAMVPHVIVTDAGQAQHPACSSCPMNEWGSAGKGRGKACRNTRRLAMVSAGNINRQGDFEIIDDEDHFLKSQIGFMKLPVTSVKGFAAYVKQIAGVLKRPPFGVITRVSVVPDPKTQLKVVFEGLDPVPDHLLEAIMARRNEVKEIIEFPYQLEVEERAPARGARGKAARGKVPARGKSMRGRY